MNGNSFFTKKKLMSIDSFENILITFVKKLYMPRNHRLRRIASPPRFSGYKPYGCPKHDDLPVELMYEEYEALKLADYKFMNHQEAALLMGVSRATFARIYENARRKIALALVEAKEIIAITGNSYSDKKWFNCSQCQSRFTIPVKITERNCPICKSTEIEQLIQNNKEY